MFIFIVIKSSKCQYFTDCYETRLYALSIILYPFFLDDVGKRPEILSHHFVVTHGVKSQTRKMTLNKNDLEEKESSLVVTYKTPQMR